MSKTTERPTTGTTIVRMKSNALARHRHAPNDCMSSLMSRTSIAIPKKQAIASVIKNGISRIDFRAIATASTVSKNPITTCRMSLSIGTY